MNISDLYNIYLENKSISTDSRNIIQGSIFFALKGNNFNGNSFAFDALEKGANYAIIDEKKYKKNDRTILVKNVLDTLQKLANFHRKKLNIPIIAITGTNGKTTTKELLSVVLASKFKVAATYGNLNNQIGVPLTLLSMNKTTEIGIVEMGANHLGEIDLLCRITEPNYGIITNIGKAHLEGFGLFDNVIKAKTELYRYIDKSKGEIFINSDNDILNGEALKLKCNIIKYGTKVNDNFCTGKLEDSNPFLKISIINCNKRELGKEEIKIETKIAGNYNFENALAACCIGKYFKIPMGEIKKSISRYVPVNNRSQFMKVKTNEFLLDFYNANPTSMEAALLSFSKYKTKLKKVLILGDMFELGNNAILEHKKTLDSIKSFGFKDVFLVGDNFKKTDVNCYKTFEISEHLKEYLKKNKIKNSLILIKGSRGVKLEVVANFLIKGK